MTRHRANAIHRHTGFSWRFRAACCCGWQDYMRDYLTREQAMTAARAHRLDEASAGETKTSNEED